MINTSYLQMLKVDEDIQHVYLESVQEIEDIVAPIRVLEMKRQQEMDLGIFTEAADILYTEGVKEAVTKIGDKIIEIVKRIKDFIKSIPDKIKEATWSKSDVDKKMNIIKKQDPKKFEEIKVYVDKGMLDFNTFESMKKFYDGYDELLAELKKKEVDEKSLKGKLEKIKTSLNNNSETIKNVAGVLGIVSAAGVIAYNYMKFRNEGDKFLANQSEKIADASLNESRKYEELVKIVNEDSIQGTTKASVAAQAIAELERRTKMNISKITNLRAFLWKKFDGISNSLTKNTKKYDKTELASEYSAEAKRLKSVAGFNRNNYNTKVSRQ